MSPSTSVELLAVDPKVICSDHSYVTLCEPVAFTLTF